MSGKGARAKSASSVADTGPNSGRGTRKSVKARRVPVGEDGKRVHRRGGTRDRPREPATRFGEGFIQEMEGEIAGLRAQVESIVVSKKKAEAEMRRLRMELDEVRTFLANAPRQAKSGLESKKRRLLESIQRAEESIRGYARDLAKSKVLLADRQRSLVGVEKWVSKALEGQRRRISATKDLIDRSSGSSKAAAG